MAGEAGRDGGGRVVNVRLEGAELSGRMVRVRILEAKNHSLLGEKAGLPW